MDVAERLTPKGLFRVGRETARLAERETVRRWLRELRREQDRQIFVHRKWGTVAAVADGHHPVSVFLSDGNKSWSATAPGEPETATLTPDQIEHIMLDSLASDHAPPWPTWHPLA